MNRREMIKLSLLSAGAMVLRATAASAGPASHGTGGIFDPPSPPVTPFVEELHRMPIKSPLPGGMNDLSLKVNGGVAPNGVPLMPKQVHEQWNGGRTDPPDDFKSHLMQVFMLSVEQPSQHMERTPRPLDQGSYGDRPDLRVFGHHAIFPVNHLGGVPGLIRTLNLARLRE